MPQHLDIPIYITSLILHNVDSYIWTFFSSHRPNIQFYLVVSRPHRNYQYIRILFYFRSFKLIPLTSCNIKSQIFLFSPSPFMCAIKTRTHHIHSHNFRNKIFTFDIHVNLDTHEFNTLPFLTDCIQNFSDSTFPSFSVPKIFFSIITVVSPINQTYYTLLPVPLDVKLHS